jgi:hypothetical protein
LTLGTKRLLMAVSLVVVVVSTAVRCIGRVVRRVIARSRAEGPSGLVLLLLLLLTLRLGGGLLTREADGIVLRVRRSSALLWLLLLRRLLLLLLVRLLLLAKGIEGLRAAKG